MSRVRGLAVRGIAVLCTSFIATRVAAQEASPPTPTEAPPAPASPSTPAAPEPAPAAAPMSDAEQQKLLQELQAAEPPAAATMVPDLSQVNLAAGLPGIQSMNPDMSIILDVAGAWFGTAVPSRKGSAFGDAPLMTGGHDPVENGFTLRQVEMAFAASVDPYLRFDASLVIKDELEVEEAYATALTLPFNLQARTGMFLSKFGRQNEQHPHGWWFISQPLVYGQLLGEDNFRGLGAEVSWLSPLPWPVTLILELQGTSGGCCSRSFSPLAAPNPVRTPLDLVTTGVLEQFFEVNDDLSVLWGLSAMTSATPYLDKDAHGEVWGTDLLLRYKPPSAESRWFVELQAEGLLRTRHPGPSLTSLRAAQQGTLTDGGAYAQLIYHPSALWGFGGRYDFVHGLEDELAVANGGLGQAAQRGAVVAEFAPTHFSRIQLEANAGTRGQGDLLWGAVINLEVAVGAHGAHAF